VGLEAESKARQRFEEKRDVMLLFHF